MPGRGQRSPEMPQHSLGILRLAEVIHTDTREFRRQLRRCCGKPKSSTVHDLRVASRRLMVWCDLLKWLGVESMVSGVRRDLKRLFRALARLRDTQVQLELLSNAPASLEEAARHCRRWLRRREKKETKRVRRRCLGIRPSRFAEELLDSLQAPAVSDRFRGNPPRLEKHLNRWRRRLVKRVLHASRRIDPVDPATLHRFRVTLKPLRYCSESLAYLGPVTDQFPLGSLRRMQSALGNVQDAEVFLAWLRGAKAAHPRRVEELRNLERWVDRRRDLLLGKFFRAPHWKALRTAQRRGG